jgi:hypothetical protein
METPHRRSKRTKKSAARENAAVPSLHGNPLLAADFDRSGWEIMYPHFVEEGLVGPPKCTDK